MHRWEISIDSEGPARFGHCGSRPWPQLWQLRQQVTRLPPPAPWSSSSDQPYVTGGVWASHLKGFLIDGAGANGKTTFPR